VRSDVGRPLDKMYISECTLRRNPVNVKNVGMPLDFVYTLLSIREFIMMKNSKKGMWCCFI